MILKIPMKIKLYIVFLGALIAIMLHLYLSDRSYSIASDKVKTSSLCNINDSLNCDNTLTSSYSEFAGLPVSNWGFATHFIIAILSLLLILGWSESPNLITFTLNALTVTSAIASLIMFSISLFILNSFCLFCIILYLLSFIIAISAFLLYKPLSMTIIKKHCFLLPGALISVILTAFLTHSIFIKIHNIKPSKAIVESNVKDWMSAPVKYSPEKSLLETGPSPEEAIMTIIEFADFLCSYCRNNYYILKLFKASNPLVRVEFFSFPLDECKSKRPSCFLTRAVYCAEKQNQGWNMQGIVFENQKQFVSVTNNEEALQKVKTLSKDLPVEWDQWLKCLNSEEALEVQNKQMRAGNNMNVQNTPSVFINGKKVHHRYFTKTIKAIQKKIKKK